MEKVVVTPKELSAAAAALKTYVDGIIENKAGFFASTIEGDFAVADVATCVDVVIDAINKERGQ